MLGLPKHTEVKKQLSKSAIYTKFQMNNAQKEKIDADISKMVIVNEILPSTVNIASGNEIQAFFVINVVLKKKDYDEKTIITISKLIPQNLLFVLECGEEVRLAVNYTKLIQSEWQPKDNAMVELKGLDLDKVWENIIQQIGDIHVEQGNSLEEQIAVIERKKKLEDQIEKLHNKIRKEKQLNVQMKLNNELKKLKKELEVL